MALPHAFRNAVYANDSVLTEHIAAERWRYRRLAEKTDADAPVTVEPTSDSASQAPTGTRAVESTALSQLREPLFNVTMGVFASAQAYRAVPGSLAYAYILPLPLPLLLAWELAVRARAAAQRQYASPGLVRRFTWSAHAAATSAAWPALPAMR